MEKKNIYENYFKTQYSNSVSVLQYYNDTYNYTQRSIGDIFNKYPKNIKILDLGCGFGGFANFCQKKGFVNYTGVDISKDELEICKNNFKSYSFIYGDIINFLKNTSEKFDIIYLSHVFEHLSFKESIDLVILIYKKLTKNGVFINYQPNADAYFGATSSRYADITHEKLWNRISYTQFIKNLGIKDFNLSFRNSFIGGNTFFNILHKVVKLFFELFIQLLGYNRQEIYTTSFYSILYKL